MDKASIMFAVNTLWVIGMLMMVGFAAYAFGEFLGFLWTEVLRKK